MYDKDDDEYGYDLVIWDSLPYTLQEDNKTHDLKKGERVVNVTIYIDSIIERTGIFRV